MAKLRLFMAIALPDEAKDKLAAIQSRLKVGCKFVDAHPRWVDVQNLHLTLVFLGNIEAGEVPGISTLLDDSTSTVPGFELSLVRLGLFPPDSKNPKVLSVDVSSEGKFLRNLHSQVTSALAASGYKLEQRPYRPHLTLARLPSIKSASRLAPLVASHASLLNIKFPVREVVLFESQLGADGPTYFPLHKSALSEKGESCQG